MPLKLTQPVPACKLWIDGVGCHLLSLDGRVILGNVFPAGDSLKVGIQADLQTRHAIIESTDSSYWIHPRGPVQLDGSTIDGPRTLCHGTQIILGEDVGLRFLEASPLSSTATLVLESGHRFEGGLDGVVLFQGVCLLGHGSRKHIHCRDWQQDVVLFRQNGQLYCKANGALELNGAPTGSPVKVENSSHLQGEDWSIRFEEVGRSVMTAVDENQAGGESY